MTDFGIYTKNADIVARAGAKANTTAVNTTATDIYVLDVEAIINCASRKNWSALVDAGPLDASVQRLLTDTGASLCAIKVIMWDMSGFTTREEAKSMINVLNDRAQKNISILRDIKTQTFILGAP